MKVRKIKRFGWKRDIPDFRDLMMPYKEVLLPASVDLRPNFKFTPFDQGELGSCTANGIAAALVFTGQKMGRADVPIPSRLAIYYDERAIENSIDQDSGAQIRDGLRAVSKCFIPESEWPYDISKFTEKPPQEQNAEHVSSYHRIPVNVNAMKTCLAQGYPFVFGITVYSSFMDATDGMIPMPTRHDEIEGGHCMSCFGYDDATQRFLILNSWGPDWGQGGYAQIPYKYLGNTKLGGDYWTIRQET